MPSVRLRFTALGLTCALALAQGGAARAETYRMVIGTAKDMSGVSKDSLTQSLQSLFDIVKKKTGIEVKLEYVGAYADTTKRKYGGSFVNEEILRRFKAGTGDFAFWGPDSLHKAEMAGLKLLPLASFTVNHKKLGEECIYVKKGGLYQKAADLKGKKINNATAYLEVRQALFNAGVNMPLDKFFGEFQFNSNWSASMDEVLAGKLDAVYLGYSLYYFSMKQKPVYRNLVPIACTNNYPMMMLVMRPGLDQKKFDNVKMILANAHRDPEFRPFKWFFMAINGEFFTVPPDYLDGYRKMLQAAAARGWLKEQQAWDNGGMTALWKKWLAKKP